MHKLIALILFVFSLFTPTTSAHAEACGRHVAGAQYANLNVVSPYEVLTSVTDPCRHDAPALITIHGGAWMTGVRADINDEVNAFYDRGWQVFNVEYRHAYSTTWGMQLRDVQAAFQWVSDHAATFGVDVHRISVMGFSAGGHLAAWLGQTKPVAATVSLSGVLLPELVAQHALGYFGPPTDQMVYLYESREVVRTGCEWTDYTTSASCKAGWDAFDPETGIGVYTTPTYMVQGMDDPTVPPETADQYGALLTSAGVRHVVIDVPGYTHVDGTVFDGTPESNARQDALNTWLLARYRYALVMPTSRALALKRGRR